MKFSATNIGRFEKVELELNGLTVISGNNGCGKTTLGKALYAATKCETYLLHNILQKKYEIIQDTLSHLQKVLFFVGQGNSNPKESSKGNKTLEKIKAFIEKNSNNDFPYSFNLQIIIDELAELLKDDKVRDILNRAKSLGIENSYDETIPILKAPVNFDDSDFNRKLVEYVFQAEFEKQLTSFARLGESSSVTLTTAKNSSKSTFSIRNNTCTSCLFGQPNFQNIIYLDDVYALDNRESDDSPQKIMNRITQKKRLIMYDKDRGPSSSFGSDHRLDLVSLLSYIAQPKDRNIAEDISLDKIAKKFDPIFREIIGGQILYSKDTKDFIFSENDESLYLRNTASGVKAIGIIELLLRNGYLHDSTCLIIDEPETHLHPEWQIKLAKLLVVLVAETSIKILLNTHSPYFVEAIRTYSKSYAVGDKTKFYFVEPQPRFSSSITDVSDDITPIFELLAKPYRTLDLAYQETL
ncbi:MAG: AAA family ATPase [Sphaerochaeta sp.]|nr:AAA family ATPase [Sphaerochaeta sp.]